MRNSLVVKWLGLIGDWMLFFLVFFVGVGDFGLEDGFLFEGVFFFLFFFKDVVFWMGVLLLVGVLKFFFMYFLFLGLVDIMVLVVRIGFGVIFLFWREFFFVLDGEKFFWLSSFGIRGLKLVFLCCW